MEGRRITLCASVCFVFLLVAHFSLLIFACVHWHDWWSLFVWLSFAVALFFPIACRNYEPADHVEHTMSPAEYQNCRELGWSFCVILGILAYGVPVLSWYNGGIPLGGVLVVFGAITCALWSYVLWYTVHVSVRQ